MELITACDSKLKDYGEHQAFICQLLGIPHKLYLLEESVDTNCLFKPSQILKHFITNPGQFAWIDSDAYPLCPIDLHLEYDIAVTIREDRALDKAWGHINAGVMFFQNSTATINFLNEWATHTLRVGHDQKALSELLIDIGKPYQIKKLRGTRVLSLPAEIYNHSGEPTKSTKILHFKGKHRDNYFKYILKF